jgi:hypothetical protein
MEYAKQQETNLENTSIYTPFQYTFLHDLSSWVDIKTAIKTELRIGYKSNPNYAPPFSNEAKPTME